jgi:hypothetical protein
LGRRLRLAASHRVESSILRNVTQGLGPHEYKTVIQIYVSTTVCKDFGLGDN